ARSEESKALLEKHAASSEAGVINARKACAEKDIRQKEKDLADLEKSGKTLNEEIEKQNIRVSKANTAVENGFSEAETMKTEFLKLFDELNDDLRKNAARLTVHDPADPSADAEDKCVFEICDVSLRSAAVKSELPLPSDENAWKLMISEMEKLEEYIACEIKKKEERVTEEEKKKASIKGELEEKEKNIEDTKKELQRLEEEKEKTAHDLKNESAELEKKKKNVVDYAALIDMNGSKRGEKLKTVSILKETVPPPRYQFNDISAKDITDAYDFLSKQREDFISEIASSESRDKEIEKSALKKEELLRAGKCPTCGRVIQADAAHPEHGTDEEMKQRTEIAARLKELFKLKADTETQMTLLKEIEQIDKTVEQIKSEIKTLQAEEKGKEEMIEKFRKDSAEIEQQKTAQNARKIEHDIFCDARRKDLEKINGRLGELQSENDRLNEKAESLSAEKKGFSDTANSILLAYKTLEAERNMSSESQKRVKENDSKKAAAEKDLKDLAADAEKINGEFLFAKAKEGQAEKVYNLISEIRSKIEKLAALGKEKERIKAVSDGQKTTMAEQNKTVANYKNRISEKEIKIKDLAAKISGESGGDLSADKKRRLEEQIGGISASAAEWDGSRTKIQEEIGRIKNEISMLSDHEKEEEILRNKLHFLSFVSEDVTVLEEMYLRIRSDMRMKNIEALDRLLNEMFDVIYSNNSYSHLELDSDYNLKVHEKDGSVLEPKQLSGGERAIFNLALRCAIYRLLSLGFGENSKGKTSLPPLIFDEPTVFLDSGHIRRLIKLIEHMREDGVGQIIVVSHDDSLIDSADVNFKVVKDPLTNASSVI
ncbi:MAG: hypothetical protein LBU81_02010, partial [Methanosarcinales archaeon]|nr:hypothetical protein [Methanosarcinales archaeon]